MKELINRLREAADQVRKGINSPASIAAINEAISVLEARENYQPIKPCHHCRYPGVELRNLSPPGEIERWRIICPNCSTFFEFVNDDGMPGTKAEVVENWNRGDWYEL